MLRKFLVAAVAAGATLGLFSEPSQADARPRARVYIDPTGAAVRWRGDDWGRYRGYRSYRNYYRPYNGVSITYGNPYYGGGYYGGGYYPTYGYGYTQPYYGGGVYYQY